MGLGEWIAEALIEDQGGDGEFDVFCYEPFAFDATYRIVGGEDGPLPAAASLSCNAMRKRAKAAKIFAADGRISEAICASRGALLPAVLGAAMWRRRWTLRIR